MDAEVRSWYNHFNIRSHRPGVTHNIPLLREIVSHPHFKAGTFSTKFLGNEFPGGFKGHVLTAEERTKLLSVAAWIHAQRDIRNRSWLHGDDGDVVVPNKWDLYLNVDKNKAADAPVDHVEMQLSHDGDFEVAVVVMRNFSCAVLHEPTPISTGLVQWTGCGRDW